MSRVAIREAVTSYLAEAALPNVGKVFSARPEVLTEQAYESNMFNEAVETADGSSAVLVVNLPSDKRQRRADTGRGAVNDTWIFDVVLEVFFASSGGEAVIAQSDYDAVIDGIVSSIRENATLGAPTTVWSAGEYDAGIKHDQAEPFTDEDGTTVFIFGSVEFQAWTWIAGNV